MTNFAQGFNTSGTQDASSFVNSELSITFSADGTTLYASDGTGVWQFKTTASLAGSTSGTLIGLNDLRTLARSLRRSEQRRGRGRHRRRCELRSVPRPCRRRAPTSAPEAWATRTWRPTPAAARRTGGTAAAVAALAAPAAPATTTGQVSGQHVRWPRHAGCRSHRPVRAPGDHRSGGDLRAVRRQRSR